MSRDELNHGQQRIALEVIAARRRWPCTRAHGAHRRQHAHQHGRGCGMGRDAVDMRAVYRWQALALALHGRASR